MDLNDLKQKRAKLIEKMEAMVAAGGEGARDLSDDEIQKFSGYETEVRNIDATIERAKTLGELSSIKYEDPVIPPDTHIDMPEKDLRNYSLMRAVRASAAGSWRGAELELEASQAVADKIGQEPRGFYVPLDWQTRDVTKTLTDHTGENIIDDVYLPGSFIDLLRKKLVVGNAGARVLTGLKGDISIPKLLTGSAGYWVAEDDAPTESTPTFGQVKMTPKTVAGYTEITRLMTIQSDPSVENLLKDDLAKAIRLAVDAGALHGTGASNQPTGVAAVSGIGAVVGGANGAIPSWGDIVDLETEVAADDADVGALAYVTNAKVRGVLKQTEKASGTAQFVWAGSQYPLNGYAAHVSNQVSSALTKGTASGICSAIFFGNWNDLIVGYWGQLDILVNPYSNDTSGKIRITAFQSADVAVRYAQSFAAMLDALTS